jgi:hypothetical protein
MAAAISVVVLEVTDAKPVFQGLSELVTFIRFSV